MPLTVQVAGAVNIGSSGQVTILGTPAVTVANTPAVTISGTPSVNISSGTVSITGTPSINIQSQSVNLNTQQPQSSLGNFVVPGSSGTNNATYAVPTGTHALALLIKGGIGLQTATIDGVQSGIRYSTITAAGGQGITGFLAFPIASVLDTQILITATSTSVAGNVTVYAVAMLDAEAVFVFDNQGEVIDVALVDATGLLFTVANPVPVTVRSQSTSGYNAIQYTTAINTPVTLFASNTGRKGVTLYLGSNVGDCAIYGNITVTAGSGTGLFISLHPGAYWELPRNPAIYTGAIKMQSLTGATNLFATEWT